MKAKVQFKQIAGYENLQVMMENILKYQGSFCLDWGRGLFPGSRYSYLGMNPFIVFKSRGNKITVCQNETIHNTTEDPFFFLKKLLSEYTIDDQMPGSPPFKGGAAGYLGYDMGRLIEKFPQKALNELSIPDCYFGFYSLIVIADHVEKKLWAAATGFPETTGRLQRFKAEEDIRQIASYFYNMAGNYFENSPLKSYKPESNFTKESYCRTVSKIKNYISSGDVYQVNLSQRFVCRSDIPPLSLYKSLQEISPAPYSCFFNCGDFQIVSASPERFLRISADLIETKPIKGTRPRAGTKAQDRRFRKELISSTKDRAELLMIIDLERNDLGKVCKFGTVKAYPLFTVEAYRDVYHLVSTVRGRIDSAKFDIMDCIKACFPGGSITGAPKIRAMEIIEEIEPCRRNLYTGAIGYLGFNGEADLNIAIRTLIYNDGFYRFNLGGGVVADSEPESEFDETLSKGRVFFEILEKHK